MTEIKEKIDLNEYVVDVDLAKVPGKEVTIKTHGQPLHSDDILSIIMIATEASEAWVAGHSLDGVILLDVPGSQFSDKKYYKKGGKKEKSTSMLVAEFLGIESLSRWKKVLKNVNHDDLNGSSDVSSIHTIFKRSQQQSFDGTQLDKAVDWLYQALLVKIDWVDNDPEPGNFTYSHIYKLMKKEKNGFGAYAMTPGKWRIFAYNIIKQHEWYFDQAKHELVRQYQQRKILIRKIKNQGKMLSIFGFESDNYRAATVTRARMTPLHLRADVVVQKGKTGIFVAANDKDINIQNVVAVLNFVDDKRGKPDAWFYNPEMNQIYNSLTHGAPASSLSIEDIVNCIRSALE